MHPTAKYLPCFETSCFTFVVLLKWLGLWIVFGVMCGALVWALRRMLGNAIGLNMGIFIVLLFAILLYLGMDG